MLVVCRCLQQEHTHQQEQQQGMAQQMQDLTQQLQEAHTAKVRHTYAEHPRLRLP